MKIAIPTNNRIDIAERTGRAKEFAVYDISEGKTNPEYRENTHEHNHDADDNHSHSDLTNLLNDVKKIYGKRFGKHFKRDMNEAGIELETTEFNKLKDLLANI